MLVVILTAHWRTTRVDINKCGYLAFDKLHVFLRASFLTPVALGVN